LIYIDPGAGWLSDINHVKLEAGKQVFDGSIISEEKLVVSANVSATWEEDSSRLAGSGFGSSRVCDEISILRENGDSKGTFVSSFLARSALRIIESIGTSFKVILRASIDLWLLMIEKNFSFDDIEFWVWVLFRIIESSLVE